MKCLLAYYKAWYCDVTDDIEIRKKKYFHTWTIFKMNSLHVTFIDIHQTNGNKTTKL